MHHRYWCMECTLRYLPSFPRMLPLVENCRRSHALPRSAGPILQAQPRDALELAGVVGDQRRIKRQGMAGDPQVVGADGRTGFLEPGELRRVVPAEGVAGIEDDRHLPRQRIEPTQHFGLAAASLRPLEQLRVGNEGHAQPVRRRQGVDPRRHAVRPVFDEVDERVGVDEVNQSASRSCMGSGSSRHASSAATKSSSKPDKASRSATPRSAGRGWMTRAPDSVRVISTCGESRRNSRGIRTAWLLPFMKMRLVSMGMTELLYIQLCVYIVRAARQERKLTEQNALPLASFNSEFRI